MADPLSFRIKKQFDRYIHDPIIAILGAKTFEFVIMPVAIGALFIVIFSLIYNKVWNR